jgi:small subunit ribosomal protein S3
MGQKVHPTIFRIGNLYSWESKWFLPKSKYAETLHEDLRIRKFLEEELEGAMVSLIQIERFGQKMRIGIHTARPGLVIGRKGKTIETLREVLQEKTSQEVHIDIIEVKRPELDAVLVAKSVADRISKRVSFRRAMKQAVTSALQAGAEGIKISCAGRLGGAELARREWYRRGRVPLQTIRADVNYGFAEADTKYGKIGVKVWIFKGEVIPGQEGLKQEGGMVLNADAKKG